MYSSTSPHPSQRSLNSSLGRHQGLSKQQSGSNLQSTSAGTPQMSPGRTRKGSRSGSSSGNRSDGEGVSYGKDYGQPYTPAFCMSQSYLGSSSLFSSGSSASLSPFQSPARLASNNLAAAGSKTKSLSLLADRATVPQAEYNGTRKHSTPTQHSVDPKVSALPYDRDQSLDRHVDRKQQRHRNVDAHYHTIGGYGRERSSSDREREYPHMGARSLEREHQLHSAASMLRSRSSDHEYRTNPQPEMFSSSPPDSSRHARDTLILDLQSQVAELNKECAILQQELDGAKDKLSSTMNSIKTFWSPELKKERAIRKEENSKHCLLVEQLKMAEIENRVSV